MRIAIPATIGLLVLAHQAVAAGIPDEYTLKVKPPDMVKIGKALGKMPYEDVADLLVDLQKQLNEQVKKPDPEPDKKPEAPAEKK